MAFSNPAHIMAMFLTLAAIRFAVPVIAADHSGISDRPDAEAVVEVFAHFLRFKTVSSNDAVGHAVYPSEFKAAHKFLAESFPNVYLTLHVEEVGNYSLLFKWEGSNTTIPPYALLAHQDVVPAEEGPGSPWTKPPFGGVIEEGWVYGRGAMDTKFSLVAILQAAEDLLADGFKPAGTIYFAFGHDEEVSGECGAMQLARLLAERKVQLDFVIDEGGNILTDGMPPLTTRPTAVIGTAEKGFESVEIQVHAPGGHSSRPPIDKSSVLEVMGRVLTGVSDNPPPLRLVQPVPDLLKALAPGASSSFLAYLFRHSTNKLVKPVITRLLAGWTPVTAALVRTTVAPTLAHAGLQDNVLPESGTIVFNFRTLPDEDLLFPEGYLWDHVGEEDKSRVDVRPIDKPMTSKIAPASGPVWDLITTAIRKTYTQYEDLLIAPNLLSGATDSRYYGNISTHGLYRFSGISMGDGESSRVHGIDERVKAKDYLLGIEFFKHVMKLMSGDTATTIGQGRALQ